jgi:hypothetical protein
MFREACQATNRSLMKVAIGGCFDFINESWKEDVETQAVHPDEPTPALSLMCAKTVKMIVEVQYMEAVSNQYFLVVQ